MKFKKHIAISLGIFVAFFIMTTGIVAAGSETNSVVYEDRIAWQDDSNGNWDIQMYNISLQKPRLPVIKLISKILRSMETT